MKIDKLPVPDGTYLVEIVSEDFNKNHMVYFLSEDGELIDYVRIADASPAEVIEIIPHMFIIRFTAYQFWKMQCDTMFNRIFEPDMIPYDSIFAWQMDKQMVEIFRHYGKIINVFDYKNTTEYKEEIHILDDFIYSKPTPIEQENECVHQAGIESRKKMLNIIKDWVL
jgi:hypothetical protein